MGTTPVLPPRSGPRPRTTPWAPHVQQDQNAPAAMQAALAAGWAVESRAYRTGVVGVGYQPASA